MSLESGGKYVYSTKYFANSVAGRQTTPVAFDEDKEIFSREKIFRGFHKRPIVLLERCNFIPLLNNDTKKYKQKIDPESANEGIKQINLHLQNLSKTCSVMLVREDLEKLKKESTLLRADPSKSKRKKKAKSQDDYGAYKCSQKRHKCSHLITDNAKSQQEKHATNVTEEQNGISINKNNKIITEQKLAVKQAEEKTEVINVDNFDHTFVETKLLADKKILRYLLKYPVKTNKKDSSKKTASEKAKNVEQLQYLYPPKKAIVDPISKKTIVSRHNCEVCGKYFSSNFTLTRHKISVHVPRSARHQCRVCKETFELQSQLNSHKCNLANYQQMASNGAMQLYQGTGADVGQLTAEDYFMGRDDFEMPAPIVQLTEYNQYIPMEPYIQQYSNGSNTTMCILPMENSRYKLVMQEVPIEF